MLYHRIPCFFLLICGLVLLYQLPCYQTEKLLKSKNKLNAVPNRRIVPLSSEDLLAVQILKEKDPLYDGNPLKRIVRKLENDDVEDLSVLDNGEFQEYQGVVGKPGVDFPVLSSIPVTNFSCRKYKSPGYYADLDTNCQVFHVCDGGRKISFLCPNGTIFRQSHLICDWWFRVDCGKSVDLYEESAEQLANDQRSYKSKSKVSEKVNLSENTFSSPENLVQDNFQHQQQSQAGDPEKVTSSQNVYPENRLQKTYTTTNKPKRVNSPENHSGNSFTPSQNSNQNSLDSKSSGYQNQPENSFYIQQTYQNANSAKHKNIDQIQNTQSYPRFFFQNTSPEKIASPKKTAFTGENRLFDSESQVLAESVNYGTGRQNQYHSQNHFTSEETPKHYTANYHQDTTVSQGVPYQQGNAYHQTSTLKQAKVQQQTIPPQQFPAKQKEVYLKESITDSGTTYHNSATYKQQQGQPTGTTYQPRPTNQYETTFQTKPTFQQGTTQQEETYKTIQTQKDSTNYQRLSISQTSPSPYSTLREGTTQRVTFTTPYETALVPQSTTPIYSTIKEAYKTTQYYNPTTYSTLETATSTSSPYDFRTTLSFNPTTIVQSNYVSENSAIDSSNRDGVNSLDSISIYYDQINNKESVQLPIKSLENKNKISVSEIILRDPLSQDNQDVSVSSNPSNSLPSILTDSTKEGYSLLFSNNSNNLVNNIINEDSSITKKVESFTEFPYYEGHNHIELKDLATEQNQGLFQAFTTSIPSYSTVPTTIAPSTMSESQQDLELRHSSDLRELAQVFSRALSAYLEDPENFRRILSEVRPTEPNLKTTTVNPYKNEVLEFSEDNLANPESYRRKPPVTPSVYPTTKEDYKSFSIASQVNDLVYSNNISDGNSYFPPSKNLYGGFQNNSLSHTLAPPISSSFLTAVDSEGTTHTYYSVSPLLDLTKDPESSEYGFSSTTHNPFINYEQKNENLIGAREVNSLAPSKNLNDNIRDELFDKTNANSNEKFYDYSFGANRIKSNKDDIESQNEDEELIPYDSQSIVSRDNLLRYQNAQKNYYSTPNYDLTENFSQTPQILHSSKQNKVETLDKTHLKENHEKLQQSFSTTPSNNYYSFDDKFSSKTVEPSTFETANFVSTEALETLSTIQPIVESTTSQKNLQMNYYNSMYKEAKELFGNLNESSANTLMNMMHEAESNTTVRRLVLLLVNDKTGRKTPEESRSKLLEALLQMPQRVPIYPPNSISRKYTPKIPRRVKVLKSRVPANNDKSSTKYQRETSLNYQNPAVNKPQAEPLLPEKLASESDSRAVELLKSLYVLAAKWG